MKIYWGGKPKPGPKEVINDEVLGTIKVFNNGLEFVDNFFPNYGGVEFKYVTENNLMIPAKIKRAEGLTSLMRSSPRTGNRSLLI